MGQEHRDTAVICLATRSGASVDGTNRVVFAVVRALAILERGRDPIHEVGTVSYRERI